MDTNSVLIITQDFPPERGGIQSYCERLAIGMARRGWRVQVVCPGKKGKDTYPFQVHRIAIPSSLLFLALPFKIPKLFRRLRPSVCILAQWQSLTTLRLLPRVSQTKLVCMIHGRELLTSVFGPLTRALAISCLARCHLLVPNSRHVAEMAADPGHRMPSIRIIHPGADRVEDERIADKQRLRRKWKTGEGFLWLTLTRLTPRKNIASVLEAMTVLRKMAGLDFHYVIAGQGSELEGLRDLARALDLSSLVTFAGPVSNTDRIELYTQADGFILPSRLFKKDVEGFGIVFLEAAAYGLPAIGTRQGGIPDAVEDGETGLLAPSPVAKDLVPLMESLMRDTSMAVRLGRQAKERFEKSLTWEHCVDNWESSVRDLTHKRESPQT